MTYRKSQPHQVKSALAPSRTEMGEPKRKTEQTENTDQNSPIVTSVNFDRNMTGQIPSELIW